MAESLVGQYEMPPISIIDMLLGGGPKPYFARRGQMSDQVWLANQEMAMRGQFAQGLLDTPAFKNAQANPYDRGANFGLWAATQGGPESIANQGASWLQTSLQAIYGREGETFSDALAKSRTRYSTDEAIRLEKTKLELANQNMQEMLATVAGPDGAASQTQVQRDATWNILAANNIVPKAPEGYSVTKTPEGQFAFTPTLGTKAWNEAMGKLSPLQQIQGATAELTALFEGQTTWDTGRAQQLIQVVQDRIRKSLEMGSLDAGTAAAMENYLPQISKSAGYLPNSGYWLTGKEKLRGLAIDVNKQLADWQRTYVIPLDDPRVKNPYKYSAEPTKPVPSTSPDQIMRNRSAEQPQGDRTSRGPAKNRAGGPAAESSGSLLDIFGSSGTGKNRQGR